MNYYIQGDAANADQIKAAFKELGYNTRGLNFSCGFFYTVERDVHYCVRIYDYMVNIIKTHPDYKELELPKSHYDISNFYAGMPVLVREYDTCHWQWVQYSHFNGVGLFFAAGKTWRQCIPFNDDTKHLLGTTDMPSEEYINW